MSVLTFLSDFGADSHYLASFRGAMDQSDVNLPFIEITSRIEPFDIVEAAYLSAMVHADFGENSVHILATNVVATSFDRHIAAYYENQYFLAPDNGILSLIFGEHFEDYYRIPAPQNEQKIQNIYLPFVAKIKAGESLGGIAEKAVDVNIKSRIRPVNDGEELRGTVLFVDHFGNAYTNIEKEEFQRFTENTSYSIQLSRHSSLDKVLNNFSDVQDGDPICYFSEHGYLVVAIKKSNAEKLLNLRKYKPIIVQKR